MARVCASAEDVGHHVKFVEDTGLQSDDMEPLPMDDTVLLFASVPRAVRWAMRVAGQVGWRVPLSVLACLRVFGHALLQQRSHTGGLFNLRRT